MERYYHVLTADHIDHYVFASLVSVSSGGALIFDHATPQDERTVFAPGHWISVTPADLNSGEAKYFDTFEEEVSA